MSLTRPAADLGRADRHRGGALRLARRLRSRHRHPVPVRQSAADRDTMMASIAPYWDGNETWLVLGGGGLLVAFPRAYAHHHAGVLPADHPDAAGAGPARRGIRVPRHWRSGKSFWDFVFAAGSTIAALCQGFVLAGFVHGITVRDGAFAGGAFDWATPFGVLCALGVVVRLCAAWRELADAQDRGRHGGARRDNCQCASFSRPPVHGRRQPLHALRLPAHRGALVRACRTCFICRRCRSSPA